jgi:hypothetical protein
MTQSDEEKAFDKIQPFLRRTLSTPETEEHFLNVLKSISPPISPPKKSTTRTLLNDENSAAFLLRPGKRQGFPYSQLLFNRKS